MPSCQCQGIEIEFNRREAANKLKAYRRSGPAATTRLLIEALQALGVKGRTLLDVGGGIGVIQCELLKAGARTAVSVDASSAYIAAAREEAQRQGLDDRIQYHHGDFVALASGIPPADVVTLDRVICCYHDMPGLVGHAAEHARQVLALVYPLDAAWVRFLLVLENLFQRIKGSPFRAFVHPTTAVEALLRERGLQRHSYRRSGVWQIAVYTR
jgi:magnesium-protoporphyrin O-methyltransferase